MGLDGEKTADVEEQFLGEPLKRRQVRGRFVSLPWWCGLGFHGGVFTLSLCLLLMELGGKLLPSFVLVALEVKRSPSEGGISGFLT